MDNSWNNMENSWKFHGKFMGKSWTILGQFMEKTWILHGQFMENHGIINYLGGMLTFFDSWCLVSQWRKNSVHWVQSIHASISYLLSGHVLKKKLMASEEFLSKPWRLETASKYNSRATTGDCFSIKCIFLSGKLTVCELEHHHL